MALPKRADGVIDGADWDTVVDSVEWQPYGYIIYKEGTTYYAKNGATGVIDYSLPTTTNTAPLIQNAYDNLTTNGMMYIKDGVYQTEDTLLFDDGEKWVIGESQSTQIYYKNDAGLLAVQFGDPAVVKNRGGMRNLRIYGYGGADVGLEVSSRYATFDNIWINSFHAGIGLKLECDYAGGMYFNNFYNLRFNDNLTDLTIGQDSTYDCNANTFYGPVFDAGFGVDTGIIITKGDTNTFINPKLSSKTTAIQIDSGINDFYAPRIEACTTGFNISATNIRVFGGSITTTATPVTDAGVNNKFRDVYGFITSNSGTATILTANTSIVVAHGCAYTPTAADITITPTENPTNTPGLLWVDTIGAANFTINCENDPGASNLDVSWSVRKI